MHLCACAPSSRSSDLHHLPRLDERTLFCISPCIDCSHSTLHHSPCMTQQLRPGAREQVWCCGVHSAAVSAREAGQEAASACSHPQWPHQQRPWHSTCIHRLQGCCLCCCRPCAQHAGGAGLRHIMMRLSSSWYWLFDAEYACQLSLLMD